MFRRFVTTNGIVFSTPGKRNGLVFHKIQIKYSQMLLKLSYAIPRDAWGLLFLNIWAEGYAWCPLNYEELLVLG